MQIGQLGVADSPKLVIFIQLCPVFSDEHRKEGRGGQLYPSRQINLDEMIRYVVWVRYEFHMRMWGKSAFLAFLICGTSSFNPARG